MGANLIDLRQAQGLSYDDLSGLHASLARWIGEPFRFARVTYGEELTLHFGDLRPARSQKLKGKLYGSYILGVRGSAWILKPGDVESLLITSDDVFDKPLSFGEPLNKVDLESGRFLATDALVLAAQPFFVRPVNGIGLKIRFSDGSSLLIVPKPPDPEEPEDEGLPQLSNWELTTPLGLLIAGPGLFWSFTPKESESSETSKDTKQEKLRGGPKQQPTLGMDRSDLPLL